MLRLRYLVRRLPIVYWVGALALVLCTGLAMARVVGGAQTAAAQFGTLRPVPVAAHAVPVGTSLDASDVRMRTLPRAVIPRGAVASTAGAVVGRVALVPLSEGEVVTAAKVAPTGLTGIAALLTDDARALAIPTTAGTPPLHPGDHVDLLASFDVDRQPGDSAGKESPPTFPVAKHATVLDVGHQAVTVAVTADEAPRLAYALTHGAITLALTAP